MPMINTSSRHQQSGVATLAVTMLLLFGMSLVALFVNRSLVLEQRISASQYRATQAFNAAEAGLEWATAMLNDPRSVDQNCLPTSSSAASFRTRYVPTDSAQDLQPWTTAHPACRINGSGLVCSCPSPGADPDLGNGDDASFAVQFEPVADQPDSIKLTSRGCTTLSADCIPGANADVADAKASQSVVLKLAPVLRILPGAALTAGGDVTLDGDSSLRNIDRVTNGILVESGGAVHVEAAARLASIAGTPTSTAVIGGEPSLNAMLLASPTGKEVFNAFFGMSMDRSRESAAVQVISASAPTSRAQALLSAYQAGHEAFYVDGELQFDQPLVGTEARPLLIVSQHAVSCSQACVLRGVIFNDLASHESQPGAPLLVRGAVITRGNHRQVAGEGIVYDPPVLSALRQRTASFARVPGSWRDF